MIILKDNTVNPDYDVAILDKLKLMDGLPLKEWENFETLFLGGNKDTFGTKDGSEYLWRIRGKNVCTGNIMGFLSIEKDPIIIRSRFSSGNNDYFLHYMLQKTFLGKMVSLEIPTGQEEIYSFLYYLFPQYLDKALSAGIYKEYIHRRYNDSNIKGRIDIKRHIKQNIPFSFKVAYDVREHSYNNKIMRLILCTIDYISKKPIGRAILSSNSTTRENISIIKNYGASVAKNAVHKIINECSSKISNPYWKDYEILRNLCLRILREEGVDFNGRGDSVHGILFDGAILWEEYLNTILSPIGFEHPNNISKHKPLYLFSDNTYKRYPDFYYKRANDYKMIADAKYKKLDTLREEYSRDDMHQLISYLYITKSPRGILLYPSQHCSISEIKDFSLNGYGGILNYIPLSVHSKALDFAQYIYEMESREKQLISFIKNMVNYAT